MRILGKTLKNLLLLPFFFVYATTMSSIIGLSYASAQVLLADDFENLSKSLATWDVSNPTVLNVLIDSAKAQSGSGVLELVYQPNTTGPGYFAPKAWTPRPEVYIRWYEKYSPGWIWSGNGQKLVFINRGMGNIQPGLILDVLWGNDQPAVVYQMPGVDLPNLYQNVGTPKGIGGGQWHCLEWYVKGGNPGATKVWIDGELKLDYSNLPFTFNAIDAVWPSAYYNEGGATPTGVPNLQYRWMDDLVVSTTRIGCLPDTGDKTPPAAPSGLRVN